MDRYKIYAKMIEKYGFEKQMLIAVEECSELQKEVLKYLRGRENYTEVAEEIADVEIMIEQLKMMFGNKAEVENFKVRKIERTKNLYLEEYKSIWNKGEKVNDSPKS